ncbi:MAG: hypothetical protein ACRD1T_23195, partial [Acidimicrobiia bacterium]
MIARDMAPDAQESGIEPVPIPQLSVRYKWLIVTGGYYSKTRFDFGTSEATVEEFTFAGLSELSRTRFETSGDRYEWDASACIYVHPYVAILGGYKKVRQRIDTITTIRDAFGLFTFTDLTDIDIEGPTIGIAASVPIGGGFGMYGSYAHGFLDTKSRTVFRTDGFVFEGGSSPDLDTTYNVAEVGFTYTHGVERLMPHMPLSAASAYAGYRYQRISTDFGELGVHAWLRSRSSSTASRVQELSVFVMRERCYLDGRQHSPVCVQRILGLAPSGAQRVMP